MSVMVVNLGVVVEKNYARKADDTYREIKS